MILSWRRARIIRLAATTAAILELSSCARTRVQTQIPPAAAQNPSPMADETRAHERLVEKQLPGTHRSLPGPLGKPVEVFIPDGVRSRDSFDLVVLFHGAAWVVAQSAAQTDDRIVSAAMTLGAGSGVYDRSFTDPAAFDTLLAGITREVSASVGHGMRVANVTLVGFSAGHGAVRKILRDPRGFARVRGVLLLDGMHTSYVPEGTPLAAGGTLDTTNLVAFEAFARAAMRGEKRFVVSHSEIFPGTFASTTETADWLIHSLGLHRTPILRWGPRGMQQLSEARSGRFELLGFAGNSAPDHIDQLHAMPELLAKVLAP